MDANTTADIEHRAYILSKVEGRTRAIEDAMRKLMLEIEKDDDVPYSIQEAAGLVRKALDIDPFA